MEGVEGHGQAVLVLEDAEDGILLAGQEPRLAPGLPQAQQEVDGPLPHPGHHVDDPGPAPGHHLGFDQPRPARRPPAPPSLRTRWAETSSTRASRALSVRPATPAAGGRHPGPPAGRSSVTGRVVLHQLEPVEAVGAERHPVGRRAHGRERYPSEQLDGRALGPPGQVELGRLGEPAQVVDAEHRVGSSPRRPRRRGRRPARRGPARPTRPAPGALRRRPSVSAGRGWGLRT